jgi:hypothetical protein
MLDINSPDRRYINDYGQPKWEFVSDLNRKILSWKPVLENSTWQAGYSVHYDGPDHYYIDNIMSIPRQPMAPYPFDPEIQDQIKYWEMGFFTGDDDVSRYFIMVNRRCIPEPVCCTGDGDIRELRIKFDASELPYYATWVITDVNTGQTVSFDKNNQGSDGFVDLGHLQDEMGWFYPGESKLFKLEPVMKTGGILLADETIPSGETFTCEDTVWTNGYDLTIENDVTISFSDSAKFIVHGGTFQIGDPDHQGSNNIFMDGDQSGAWKGFEFDTCNVKIYGVNFSGLANDSISMLTMVDCPIIDFNELF